MALVAKKVSFRVNCGCLVLEVSVIFVLSKEYLKKIVHWLYVVTRLGCIFFFNFACWRCVPLLHAEALFQIFVYEICFKRQALVLNAT